MSADELGRKMSAAWFKSGGTAPRREPVTGHNAVSAAGSQDGHVFAIG